MISLKYDLSQHRVNMFFCWKYAQWISELNVEQAFVLKLEDCVTMLLELPEESKLTYRTPALLFFSFQFSA